MTDSPERPVLPPSVAAAAASKKTPAAAQTQRASREAARRRAALERDDEYQPQWDRLTRMIVSVGLVLAAIYMLTVISPILQVLIIALLIAFVMFFFARAVMHRTRLGWAASVVIVYIVLLVGIFGGIGGLVPPIAQGISSVSSGLQDLYANVRERLLEYEDEHGIVTLLGVTVDLNPFVDQVRGFILGSADPDGVTTAAVIELTPEPPAEGETTTTVITETTVTQGPAGSTGFNPLDGLDLEGILGQVTNLFGTLTSALGSITSFIGNLLFAVFISFLIMLELPRTNRSIGDWIPVRYHREATILIDKTEKIWVGFLRGQVIIGIIIGVVTFIQLTVMGVQSALLLAIIVALISLIPTIGGVIALAPLFLVPLLQGSSVFVDMPNGTFALLVTGINLLISQVIWNVVAPKILGDALNLPVVVIIVGVFVGAAVGGVLGAFLVAPIMSTIWLFVTYLVRKIAQKDPFPGLAPLRELGRAEFAELHADEEDDASVGLPAHPADTPHTTAAVPGPTLGELK